MRLRHIIAAAFAAAVIGTTAFAQSTPNFVFGQVPTAAQWNSYFAAKQDYLGFTPVNLAGDTMHGELIFAPSGTGGAGANFTPGLAPSSPVNGDLWVTSSSVYARAGGTTIDLGGGVITCARLPALTGDVTTTAGSCATTARVFGTSQSGIVPASGGGSSNFLRADGTWAAPGGGGTCGSDTQYVFNDASACGASDAIVSTNSYSAAWAKAIDEADFTGNFSGTADITSQPGNDLQFYTADNPSGASGSFYFTTGVSSGTNATGGVFEVDAGAGNGSGSGGGAFLDAGSSGTGNDGAEVASDGGGSIAGGNAGIYGGNAAASTAYNGGTTQVRPGAVRAGGTGHGGQNQLFGGDSVPTSGFMTPPHIFLDGDTSTVAGDIEIRSGDAWSTTGADAGTSPGNITITAGQATSNRTAGTITVTAGAGVASGHSPAAVPGNLVLNAGATDSSGQSGGQVQINGGGGDPGGDIRLFGGLGGSSSASGSILAQGGSSNNGGTAGNFTGQGGNAQFLNDTPGNATLQGGTGNSNSPTGPGNAIVHGGNNGGGSNHDGGLVELVGGTPVGTGITGWVDASGVSFVVFPHYTVATLPACGTKSKYGMAYVTDSAASPTYDANVSGGGSTIVPVSCDGTNWTNH